MSPCERIACNNGLPLLTASLTRRLLAREYFSPRDSDASAIVKEGEAGGGALECVLPLINLPVSGMRCEMFVAREKSQRKKLPAAPAEAAKRKCRGMHYHGAVSFRHSRYLVYTMSPCIFIL